MTHLCPGMFASSTIATSDIAVHDSKDFHESTQRIFYASHSFRANTSLSRQLLLPGLLLSLPSRPTTPGPVLQRSLWVKPPFLLNPFAMFGGNGGGGGGDRGAGASPMELGASALDAFAGEPDARDQRRRRWLAGRWKRMGSDGENAMTGARSVRSWGNG